MTTLQGILCCAKIEEMYAVIPIAFNDVVVSTVINAQVSLQGIFFASAFSLVTTYVFPSGSLKKVEYPLP